MQQGLANYVATLRGPALKEARMTKPTQKEIAARAYAIWEERGRPEGKEDEFWKLAEQELSNEDDASAGMTSSNLQ